MHPSGSELLSLPLPSGWSCLGLVRHLAMDDERFWFRGVVAGEQEVKGRGRGRVRERVESPAPRTPPKTFFTLYREEAVRTNAIIANTPLDAAPAWWPDFFGEWRMDSLREVVLHVLTETATHAGHLDAVRELIDGRTWMVLLEYLY